MRAAEEAARDALTEVVRKKAAARARAAGAPMRNPLERYESIREHAEAVLEELFEKAGIK